MDRRNARAAPGEGPPRKIQQASQPTEPRSLTTVTRPVDLAIWRERAAWMAAATHLNRAGCAAAVPPDLVSYLRRRGLIVWACGDRQAA